MAPTLLTLPPELRQLIYDHLTITTTTLSAPDPRTERTKKHRQGWHPYVQLARTRDPILLLICKKISAEYQPRLVSGSTRTLLGVDLKRAGDIFDPRALKMKEEFPVECLKEVKQCRITLSWSNFGNRVGDVDERFMAWRQWWLHEATALEKEE